MNLHELLADLSRSGVKLWVESGQLRLRAPKGVLTDQIRERLSQYKSRIIQLLEEPESNWSESSSPLVPVSRDRLLPLSFEQERLWLVEQVASDTFSNNLVQALRLSGRIEPLLLEKSLDEIVQRHESLRTTFVTANGQPWQKITTFSVSLPVETVADLPDAVDGEAHRSFDIENGPLWRFRLLQLDTGEKVLLITLHHLIGDILSLGVLIRELAEYYTAFSLSRSPVVEPLEIQYADFAIWQKERSRSEEWQKDRQYWQKYLDNLPVNLDLPTDRPRKSTGVRQGHHYTFQFPPELWTAVKQWGLEHGATSATFLLSAFELLLYLLCEQEEMVIGFPTSGRFHPSVENTIGFFGYPLALRVRVAVARTFEELIERVREESREILAHQQIPFSQVIEMLGGRGQSRRSPILPVLFSVFLGKQIETLQAGEITLSPLPFATRTPTDLDLLWSLYEVDGVLNGVLGYDSQLFDLDTVQELVRSYEGILSLALQYPEKSISEFRLTSLLEKKVREYHDRQRKNTVAISATFTSEPLTDTLHFWFEELGLNYHVQFAPYNQVFQQLLDETSLLARNQSGIDIILLRWEDWLRFTGDGTPMETLRKNLADLSLSLAAAVSRTAIPTFVCLCPSPLQECHPELDEEFVASLVSLEGVYPIVPADFSVYPVTERDDPRGDELGHIPYTPMFYTAIATVLARKVHALVRSPYKVVVVDGDNTLWKGVCGEDGVEGIQVSAPYRDLQTFLVEQQREGILLGLCSKNAEADVREVFARHPDMVLRWEHLAAWRVNWQSKSGNLKALARELRLSLDSFIFLDDNPVEIAEVTANCPEVLALLLPSDSGNISRFSRRVWAFDRLKVTGEDRQRSTFYRQNAQREQVRSTSMTLADFIEGLNLQITIAPMKPEQVARVAQLTRRTNQFNATGRQRDESEIQALYRSGSPRARVVEVSDRFGDYGLVGVIFYTPIEKIVQVDTFLLSCRTLGRGVEHRMLASIAERAKEAGCEWIDIPYRFTEKNQPVLDFLQSIDGAIGTTIEGGYNFRVPTALAIDIQYRSLPAELPPRSEVPPASPSGIRFQPGQIRRIVEELSDPEALWREIQCRYRRVEPLPKEFTEPRSELERELVGLWREFLPVERVGVRDNFFELGGDSILTIQLIARAYRIGLKFTPTQLFENPTIERLARVVTRLTPPATDDPERSEPLSLSPIQREFLAKNPIDPHRFHYSLLLETSPTVDPALLERAVRALITRHEILGCRFRQDLEGEWQISREESADENFWRTIDVSALSDGEREKVLETTLERLHEGLNLERGPLFSGSLFHYGRGAPRRLLLTAHRLVIDTASWAILLDDLATTYQQLEREEPPSPSPIETPYRVWVKRSNELPRMEKNDREVIADSKPALPVPIEVPEREEDETGIDVYQLSLDLQEVPLLSPEVHQAYNTRPEDVLLAAALSSFGRWTKKSRVRVDVEKSARENPPAGLDLSRTAGWLGDILPVEYPYTEIEGPEKFLKQVKELLRRLERGEKENPAPTERALCYFHYLGSGEPPTVTAPFTAIAREVRERDRSFTRFYGLKIEASLVAGRLEMNWIYDRHVHRRSPVEHLARDFIESLQSLVRHCIDREVGGYTPSDFPDANLTSEELTSLLSLLD